MGTIDCTVVDPWGKVLSTAYKIPNIIYADIGHPFLYSHAACTMCACFLYATHIHDWNGLSSSLGNVEHRKNQSVLLKKYAFSGPDGCFDFYLSISLNVNA